MKKILFAFMAACIPALVIINEADAQNSNNIAALAPVKDVIKMDNSMIAVNNAVSLTSINIKAVRDFKNHYGFVNDEKWYKISDGFTAYFNSDGINNIIFYDKNGYRSGSLKKYTEDKLARDIRSMVKRVYYDFKITYVNEVENIHTNGTPIYIVHLEDSNSIKLVKVSNDEMEVYQEFHKNETGK